MPVGQNTAHILVVEDARMNQILVEALLGDAGYEVTVVGDGLAGVDAARVGNFDAVLMDLEMPVMDGMEATLQIRGLDGSAGRIPIVAMTAHSVANEAQRCRDVGMDDFITKPIDPDQLLRVVARWTGGTDGAV